MFDLWITAGSPRHVVGGRGANATPSIRHRGNIKKLFSCSTAFSKKEADETHFDFESDETKLYDEAYFLFCRLAKVGRAT